MLSNLRLWAVLCVLFSIFSLSAQTAAIKTNALYWATTTPNIDAEIKLAPKWSAELSVGYNPFNFANNKKIKHIAIQPEVRYWFCNTFAGQFVGAHLLYSHYNAGGWHLPFNIWSDMRKHRFQGDLGGIGVAYGYNLMLSRRFSLEFELGLGLMVTRYKEYECRNCGSYMGTHTRAFFSPTKAAINFVYYLK